MVIEVRSHDSYHLHRIQSLVYQFVPDSLPHDHLLLDSSLNIGPLISRWELGKFKNC